MARRNAVIMTEPSRGQDLASDMLVPGIIPYTAPNTHKKTELLDITSKINKALNAFDTVYDAAEENTMLKDITDGINGLESGALKYQLKGFINQYKDMVEELEAAKAERDQMMNSLADWFSATQMDSDIMTADDDFVDEAAQENLIQSKKGFDKLRQLTDEIERQKYQGKNVQHLEMEKQNLQMATMKQFDEYKNVVVTNKEMEQEREEKDQISQAWKYAATEICDILNKVRNEGTDYVAELERRIEGFIKNVDMQAAQVKRLKAELKAKGLLEQRWQNDCISATNERAHYEQLSESLDEKLKGVRKKFDKFKDMMRRNSPDDDDDYDDDDNDDHGHDGDTNHYDNDYDEDDDELMEIAARRNRQKENAKKLQAQLLESQKKVDTLTENVKKHENKALELEKGIEKMHEDVQHLEHDKIELMHQMKQASIRPDKRHLSYTHSPSKQTGFLGGTVSGFAINRLQGQTSTGQLSQSMGSNHSMMPVSSVRSQTSKLLYPVDSNTNKRRDTNFEKALKAKIEELHVELTKARHKIQELKLSLNSDQSQLRHPTPVYTEQVQDSTATVPGATVPGATVPGATVPGATVPGATVPGATVPGATVPGATVSGTAVPESIVPEESQLQQEPSVHAAVATDSKTTTSPEEELHAKSSHSVTDETFTKSASKSKKEKQSRNRQKEIEKLLKAARNAALKECADQDVIYIKVSKETEIILINATVQTDTSLDPFSSWYQPMENHVSDWKPPLPPDQWLNFDPTCSEGPQAAMGDAAAPPPTIAQQMLAYVDPTEVRKNTTDCANFMHREMARMKEGIKSFVEFTNSLVDRDAKIMAETNRELRDQLSKNDKDILEKDFFGHAASLEALNTLHQLDGIKIAANFGLRLVQTPIRDEPVHHQLGIKNQLQGSIKDLLSSSQTLLAPTSLSPMEERIKYQVIRIGQDAISTLQRTHDIVLATLQSQHRQYEHIFSVIKIKRPHIISEAREKLGISNSKSQLNLPPLVDSAVAVSTTETTTNSTMSGSCSTMSVQSQDPSLPQSRTENHQDTSSEYDAGLNKELNVAMATIPKKGLITLTTKQEKPSTVLDKVHRKVKPTPMNHQQRLMKQHNLFTNDTQGGKSAKESTIRSKVPRKVEGLPNYELPSNFFQGYTVRDLERSAGIDIAEEIKSRSRKDSIATTIQAVTRLPKLTNH